MKASTTSEFYELQIRSLKGEVYLWRTLALVSALGLLGLSICAMLLQA